MPSPRRPLLGRDVYLVDGARTPFGRSHPEKGWFRDTHPNDLLGAVYRTLLQRTGIAPGVVEDLIVGCTAPFGEQSRNIGRNAWLQEGYPPEVPAVVLDRRCGSAQTASEMGAALVASGVHDLVITAGVEHMGHIPMNAPAAISEQFGEPWTPRMWEQYDFVSQGESAELIADRWNLGRAELDEYGARSHRLAAAAIEAGRFDGEIIPWELDGEVRTSDQTVRPGTTTETLAGLKTSFRSEGGRITAGTSSPISDGAAGLLLASESAAAEHGLTPRARILDQTTVGVDPIIMLTGPIPATHKILERTGLAISDIDLFEVNEAFSSVVLAWQLELKPDPDRVNVNGGAIALGHPVGASGSRLLHTAVAELERRDAELALVTMCCGGGLGTATLLQRV